jgi:hypothetical protein
MGKVKKSLNPADLQRKLDRAKLVNKSKKEKIAKKQEFLDSLTPQQIKEEIEKLKKAIKTPSNDNQHKQQKLTKLQQQLAKLQADQANNQTNNNSQSIRERKSEPASQLLSAAPGLTDPPYWKQYNINSSNEDIYHYLPQILANINKQQQMHQQQQYQPQQYNQQTNADNTNISYESLQQVEPQQPPPDQPNEPQVNAFFISNVSNTASHRDTPHHRNNNDNNYRHRKKRDRDDESDPLLNPDLTTAQIAKLGHSSNSSVYNNTNNNNINRNANTAASGSSVNSNTANAALSIKGNNVPAKPTPATTGGLSKASIKPSFLPTNLFIKRNETPQPLTANKIHPINAAPDIRDSSASVKTSSAADAELAYQNFMTGLSSAGL